MPAGAAAGRPAGEDDPILTARGVYMSEQRKWEVLQEYGDRLGGFGSLVREEIDKETLVAWVSGLAPWDAFGTFTFGREGVSVAGATRCFEKFCKRWLKGVPVIYFVEPNPTRGDGGHHLHALLHLGGAERRRIWELWFKQYGVNRIEPIANIGGVAGYCCKLAPYVTKSVNKGGLWWNTVYCRPVWQEVVIQKEAHASQVR